MRNIQRRYIHSAIARRNSRTPASGGVYPNYSIVGPLRCLVLALSNTAQNAMIGRVEQARYSITWSEPKLLDGDVIEWDGRNFLLREILDDTVGGYYTGVLQEFKGG